MSKWLIDELKTVCPNVSRGFSPSKADTYINVQLIHSAPLQQKNDSFDEMYTRYRIHLFSKKDYTEKKNEILRLLKDKVSGLGVEAELYEPDTGYFHVPIYCKIIEEI